MVNGILSIMSIPIDTTYERERQIRTEKGKVIYIYYRSSTKDTDTAAQQCEMHKYLRRRGIDPITECVSVYDEARSGTISWRERKLGIRIVLHCQANDEIITTEASRIGRNMLDSQDFGSLMLRMGIKLTSVKDNFTLENDPTSLLIADARYMVAHMERELFSQRVKAGLDKAVAAGKIIGRPVGHFTGSKCDDHNVYIQEMVSRNVPWKTIATKMVKDHKVEKITGATIASWYRRRTRDGKKLLEEKEPIDANPSHSKETVSQNSDQT